MTDTGQGGATFTNPENLTLSEKQIIFNAFVPDTPMADRFYIIPIDAIEVEETLGAAIAGSTTLPRSSLARYGSNKKKQRVLSENLGTGLGESFDYIDRTSGNTIESYVGRNTTRGYTSPKIISPSADPRTDDNYHDALDPSAPWNLYTEVGDTLSRIQGQLGDINSTEEVLFKNHYGEVTEDIWNRLQEEVPLIKKNTTREKVIDLVLDASPVFSKIGESYDPLMNQELGGNSQISIANVMEYMDANERRAMVQTQDNRIGPGYTFVLQPIDNESEFGESTGMPRLADNFGYKRSFNYREDTIYNKFRARKTGNVWSIGEQQVLKRNEYKIPVRILITNGEYIKVVVPEILDFNDRSKDSKRSTLLSQAFSKICTDFVDSINSTYEMIREDESHTDHEIELYSDPVKRFEFVKRKVPDFPVFCRTSDNHLPNVQKNSVMSISKLYSVAAQLEASQGIGNFTNEQSGIDALFAKDRGLRKRTKYTNFVAPAGRRDINPQNIRAMLRDYYSFSTIDTRGYGYYTGNRTGQELVNKVFDVYPHIQRQTHLAGRALGEDHLNDALLVSNVVTWFQQRRSDSFWGHTFNVSEPDRNAYVFKNYHGLPTDALVLNTWDNAPLPVITQLPTEECSFRAGNSMFLSDGRTYDWQLTQALIEMVPFKYTNRYNGDPVQADMDSYNKFKKSLRDLRSYVFAADNGLKGVFGDNYVDDPDYKNQYLDYTNELGPSVKEFLVSIDDMIAYHALPMKPFRLSEGASAFQYPESSQQEIIAYSYYRQSYTIEAGTTALHYRLQDNYLLEHFLENADTRTKFAIRDSAALGYTQNLGTSDYPINVAPITDDLIASIESDLNVMRSSRQNLTLRYNAALGPQGLNVLEDIIDILASYSTVDENGNSSVQNILRGSKITQGLRLMHNLDTTMAGDPAQVEMLKYESLAQSNVFQQEERQGLMILPTQSGRQGSIFTSEIASYEKEIVSIDCWSRGESFIDVFNSMDNFMLDELKKTTEYRAYNELCFPAKKYAALMTVHSTSMLGGYNTMPTVLASTKDIMASIFSLMTSGTDFEKLKFGNEFSNIELRNMIDDGMSSGGPDDCFSAPSLGKWYRIVSEMVEEMIKKFPSLVLRGIADQIDPAYKEIKTHWTNCQLDGFGWQGQDSGQVITPITRRSRVQTGVHKPGENGTYAPVNVAFPVDLAYGIGRLIDLEPEFLGASIAKLIQYIGTGNLPLLDPSYAFQIPCKDIDASGDLFDSKFNIGTYGRYGHPLTIFTALALATPVLPGDRRQKEQVCELRDQTEIDECEDDEE